MSYFTAGVQNYDWMPRDRRTFQYTNVFTWLNSRALRQEYFLFQYFVLKTIIWSHSALVPYTNEGTNHLGS